MSRFAVDPEQVARVRRTALDLFDQLPAEPTLNRTHRMMLDWATGLHEIGLALSHVSYQQHSAYLVEASDMAGFSRQEQLFLAALVGYQRRDLTVNYNARIPVRLHKALSLTLLCMRLSWIFCRTRENEAIPNTSLRLDGSTVHLSLPSGWRENHPLTIADLEFEEKALQNTGLQLVIEYTEHEPA